MKYVYSGGSGLFQGDKEKLLNWSSQITSAEHKSLIFENDVNCMSLNLILNSPFLFLDSTREALHDSQF